MSLFVFGSLKGAPGVTTAALALALAWERERRVLIAELDAAGGDLAVRLGLKQQPGLVSLAAAVRRDQGSNVIESHTQRVDENFDVLVAPPAPDHARAALARIDAVLPVLAGMPDSDVIADIGRIADTESGPSSLLRTADVSVLVVRPVVSELQHLSGALPLLQESSRQLQVLLVGKGPYSALEIASTLGVEVISSLPHDPRTADALNDGFARRPQLSRSPLLRSARDLATALARVACPVHELSHDQEQVPA